MKKIVLAGLMAVSLIALSQQQASAWVNTKFGVGLNWELQSGGNNILWGAWKNGQPPGPEAFGGGAPYGGAPFGGGAYGGGAYGGGGMAPQNFAPAPQAFAPMPQANAYPMTEQQPYAGTYFASPYQFATYPRPVYTPAPVYYYYGR